MVTERKGCGINHAVNGGFSFACGHCARANEPDMDLGQMARRTVEIVSRDKLVNFSAGLPGLMRDDSWMHPEIRADRKLMDAQIASEDKQADWVGTQLGDVEAVYWCDMRSPSWDMSHVEAMRTMPDQLEALNLDAATVGDVGAYQL